MESASVGSKYPSGSVTPQGGPSQRLLLPALLLFAAVAGTLQVRSVDVFWHLASGRWILEHGRVPTADPFRFTHQGAAWVDHEWLFQVIVGGLERLGGIPALTAFRAALVVLLAAALWGGLRRAGAPPAAAALTAVAALLAARGRFLLRPELVSLLLLALFLALLQAHRRQPRPGRLALLAGVVALWANLHPAALAAPGLAAAHLLGSRLPGGSGPPARGAPLPWGHVLLAPPLLALALLANPYGVELLAVPLRIGRSLSGLPGFNPEWLPLWLAPRPFVLAFLAAIAALAVVAAWRTRRVDPATGLVALLLLALAVRSVRHVGLFAIGGAFFAGEALAALAHGAARSPKWQRRAAPLALLATALAAAWVVVPPPSGPLRPRGVAMRFGVGIQPGLFPAAAVERVAAWPGLGNLYNDVAFGGYLLWRLYPPRQVFIDSRNEVDPGLLRELAAARSDSRRWQGLLDRHQVDGALVRYDERPRPVVIGGVPGQPVVEHHTSSALFFPPEQFALVHWDDVALLFVRRTPGRREELAAVEYRFVQPEDWRAMLARAAADSAVRAGALRELRRKLAEEPGSRRARELLLALDGLDRR
ncbi:MAG TPA: hypothetical protein VMT16_07425 [Thermoanaerobaculia bacterium]|nr:hypothetical protein [Thermoanaerobaculia bacterium]